jgi:hypothetical protein
VIRLKRILITIFTLIAFATSALAVEVVKPEVKKPVIAKKVKVAKPVLKAVSSVKKTKKKK